MEMPYHPSSRPNTREQGLVGSMEVYLLVFDSAEDANDVVRVLNAPTMGVFAAPAAMAPGGMAPTAGGKVNINTGGVEELSFLHRIGAVLAARIIEFREANGPFESTDDLMLVKGIGERTLELIEPHVSLSGATTLTEEVSAAKKAKSRERK